MPKVNASGFAIMPVVEALTRRAENDGRETAYGGRYKKWKHWEGRRYPTAETHTPFMYMPFMHS